MTDWKGGTLEQVARHVMVVIAVCTLIDVRKNSWHPNCSGSESTGILRQRTEMHADYGTEQTCSSFCSSASCLLSNSSAATTQIYMSVLNISNQNSEKAQWAKMCTVQTEVQAGLKGSNSLSIRREDSKSEQLIEQWQAAHFTSTHHEIYLEDSWSGETTCTTDQDRRNAL